MDTFSKFLEIGAIPALNAHETAVWFHANIICRYGVPYHVRTDKGTEYMGKFDAYLQANGI